VPFRDPGSWSEQTYADRRGDVELVIGEMLADPEFGPRTDRRRTGVAGHSLGGYMVLGLAGVWTSWRDARAPRVNSIGNRNPGATVRDLRRAFRKLRAAIHGCRQVAENIWVLSPLAIPFHGMMEARQAARAASLRAA
jgi:predicted dienelactone hydrolase